MTFCNVGPQGQGYVMGAWFMPSFSSDPQAWCSLLWFKGWTLDTPTKYILAMICIFMLAVSNEILSAHRRRMDLSLARSRVRPTIREDAIRSLLYGLQMAVAYFLMLVAMLYESGVDPAVT